MVTACNKTPHMQVVPVPAKDVGKLGRIFYEFWYQGHQLKGHAEAWGWTLDKDDPSTCRFRVVHSIREEIASPSGAYAINMNTGTALLDETARFLPRALPVAREQKGTEEDSQKQAVMAALREQGYGGVADRVEAPQAQSKVAGQPCIRTDGPDSDTSCVWSGGAQWGFGTVAGSQPMLFTWMDHPLTGVGELVVPYGGLTLSNKPADGYGWRLTTQSMTVGKPLAHGIFELPPNIDIRPKEQ